MLLRKPHQLCPWAPEFRKQSRAWADAAEPGQAPKAASGKRGHSLSEPLFSVSFACFTMEDVQMLSPTPPPPPPPFSNFFSGNLMGNCRRGIQTQLGRRLERARMAPSGELLAAHGSLAWLVQGGGGPADLGLGNHPDMP